MFIDRVFVMINEMAIRTGMRMARMVD